MHNLQIAIQKDYDILVGQTTDTVLKKVQVKSVRSQPWYVKIANYSDSLAGQITIFVLLGDTIAQKPVRYFITKNKDIADHIHRPPNWRENAFMPLSAIKEYQDRWDILNQ